MMPARTELWRRIRARARFMDEQASTIHAGADRRACLINAADEPRGFVEHYRYESARGNRRVSPAPRYLTAVSRLLAELAGTRGGRSRTKAPGPECL